MVIYYDSELPEFEDHHIMHFSNLDMLSGSDRDDDNVRTLFDMDSMKQQLEPLHSAFREESRIECFPVSDHIDSDAPRWKTKSPDQWSIADADEWLFHARIDVGQSFSEMGRRYNKTGREMLELSREHFVTNEYLNGGRIYDMLHRDNIFRKSSHENSNPLPPCKTLQKTKHWQISEDEMSQSYVSDTEPDSSSEVMKKRSPGRPRVSKPSKKQGRVHGKLWEFIRDLLHNPSTNPSLICWENYEEGKFRFNKSTDVAKRWGARKSNEKMNYEKLSRAMRYYYKNKVFQPVNGRRLVYKFGENAKGWRTENPIPRN